MLNRPEKRNALNPAICMEMIEVEKALEYLGRLRDMLRNILVTTARGAIA